MGFFTKGEKENIPTRKGGRNPFQGGMGFFTRRKRLSPRCCTPSRNPFQGGMGFFTGAQGPERARRKESQSLSGWDGVFHPSPFRPRPSYAQVAIPFRVGWGFSRKIFARAAERAPSAVAIPFRVGWGFSLGAGSGKRILRKESQSLSGWDGVFHRPSRFGGGNWPS